MKDVTSDPKDVTSDPPPGARGGGGRRGRATAGPDDRRRPSGTAKDRALGLLAVRWRSREELRRRLARAGFDDQAVETALTELEAAGFVDDERFARELVRDRAVRRLDGPRAIRAALREMGVESEIAEDVLTDAGDEAERAVALATRRAARLTAVAPEAASRRLYRLLLGRGYSPSVARDAVATVLPGERPEMGD